MLRWASLPLCLSVPGGCSPLTENPTRFQEASSPNNRSPPRPVTSSSTLTTVHKDCKTKKTLKNPFFSSHFSLTQRYRWWGCTERPSPKGWVGISLKSRWYFRRRWAYPDAASLRTEERGNDNDRRGHPGPDSTSPSKKGRSDSLQEVSGNGEKTPVLIHLQVQTGLLCCVQLICL